MTKHRPHAPRQPGRRAEQARAQHERRRRQKVRGAWIAAAVVVVAAAVTVPLVVAGSGPGRGVPAVQAVGSPQGNQLHQFTGSQHAPFIELSQYYPIWEHKNPNYVLVDVREAAERALAHIPNDVWVPLADMAYTGWRYLNRYRGKTLVLYCDCPWEEAAAASVILKQHGWTNADLRVLHQGIPGWEQTGYPVLPGGNVCVTEHDWPQACGAG